MHYEELVSPAPPAESLSYALRDQERMAEARNYFAWQGRYVSGELGRRVVEVGCGIGNFTPVLLDRDTVVALDSRVECIERLAKRYPNHKNLHLFPCGVESEAFLDVAAFQPDSCVCLNVLEHVRDDAKALAHMASVLVPGGVIVLLVPAFQALYGPIDRKLGHYRRYRRRRIVELAGAAGLRVRKLQYWNFAGFFGWWVNARIFRRQAQSEWQIAVFDRSIVPLMSRLEALVTPPIGQSLFVVLEKPS